MTRNSQRVDGTLTIGLGTVFLHEDSYWDVMNTDCPIPTHLTDSISATIEAGLAHVLPDLTIPFRSGEAQQVALTDSGIKLYNEMYGSPRPWRQSNTDAITAVNQGGIVVESDGTYVDTIRDRALPSHLQTAIRLSTDDGLTEAYDLLPTDLLPTHLDASTRGVRLTHAGTDALTDMYPPDTTTPADTARFWEQLAAETLTPDEAAAMADLAPEPHANDHAASTVLEAYRRGRRDAEGTPND
jgi:hypothetical protein